MKHRLWSKNKRFFKGRDETGVTKYFDNVLEWTVQHTREGEINPFMPHVRGCASSKPSLHTGPNRKTCIRQSPHWINQQGALSRADDELYCPSSEKGTDAYPAVEVGMLMLSSAYTIKPNSSAFLIGAGGPVSQQFLWQIVIRCVWIARSIAYARLKTSFFSRKRLRAYLLINISAIILYVEKCKDYSKIIRRTRRYTYVNAKSLLRHSYLTTTMQLRSSFCWCNLAVARLTFTRSMCLSTHLGLVFVSASIDQRDLHLRHSMAAILD